MTQWFDTDKARRLLGYEPLFTPLESFTRTRDYFVRHMRAKLPPGRRRYPPGAHAFKDTGADFRPDAPAYLARKPHGLSFVPWVRDAVVLAFLALCAWAWVQGQGRGQGQGQGRSEAGAGGS